LKQVSRSFYLSLVVLPSSVRRQVSLAYLFCRAADTLADTRILPYDKRLQMLQVFRRQFRVSVPSAEEIAQLQSVLLPHQGTVGEQHLLRYLPECFQLLQELAVTDQKLIRELVVTLTRGMEMDLSCFPPETAGSVQALPDIAALDRYTYYVAGVVGEFWTKIHLEYLPALCHQDVPSLCALGVRFGKGLQLTNILKDLGRDLENGRCYLPAQLLQAVQVAPDELRNLTSLPRLYPVLSALVRYTLTHLDHAHEYIHRLPRRTVRLRLSCMWPLLFALQTLEVICTSEALFDPRARVKITRRAVYQTMLWSLCCLVSRRSFVRYYTRFRQRVLGALEAWGDPIEIATAPLGEPAAKSEREV
jgi:farnesyl-diphosphate farnesyltransferase